MHMLHQVHRMQLCLGVKITKLLAASLEFFCDAGSKEEDLGRSAATSQNK